MPDVVHRAPIPGQSRTPCCFTPPTALQGATFTTDPTRVTCDPIARAAGELPPLREPTIRETGVGWAKVAPSAPPVEACWRVMLTRRQAARLLTLAAAAHVAGAAVDDGDDELLALLREVGR